MCVPLREGRFELTIATVEADCISFVAMDVL